ncbi:unnamed protein product [Camellia sinensis]
MEEESKVCWRKEVDTNMKRLYSLLFGADLALQKQDFTSTQVLTLRLVSFLDSQSHTDVNEAFIRPVRRDALSKINTARRSLIPNFNRQAFEQTRRDPRRVFGKIGNMDIKKIRQTKYFQAPFHWSREADLKMHSLLL